MKFTKKIGVLTISAIIALSAAGCGNGASNSTTASNDSSVSESQDKKDELTIEERVVAANEKMKDVKNMESSMVIEMEMAAGEETASMVTTTDITYFTEPLKMKMDMSMDMGDLGKQSMTMYADEVDGVHKMYITDGSQWVTEDMPEGMFEEYDAKDAFEMYLDGSVEYREVGTESMANGVEAIKIEGSISGDKLKEIIEETDSIDSMEEEFDLEESTLEGIYDNLGELPINIWIDAESNYPLKYEIDMTGVMQKLMENIIAAVPEADTSNASAITKYKISMTSYNFNEAGEFEIPAEAK